LDSEGVKQIATGQAVAITPGSGRPVVAKMCPTRTKRGR
jgi:hypothetical protein